MSLEEHNYLFKILLLGDTAVGKTCLMLRFCEDKFVEQHNPTIGVTSRFRTRIHILGFKIQLQIWDPRPPTDFKFRPSYFQSVDGVVILQNPSQPIWQSLPYWLKEIDRFAPDYVSKIIVASKCDLKNTEQISRVEKFAEDNGIAFMKISAKNSMNCEECIIDLVHDVLLKRIKMDAEKDMRKWNK